MVLYNFFSGFVQGKRRGLHCVLFLCLCEYISSFQETGNLIMYEEKNFVIKAVVAFSSSSILAPRPRLSEDDEIREDGGVNERTRFVTDRG